MNREREAIERAVAAFEETKDEIYTNAEAIKGKNYASALREITEILKANEGIATMLVAGDMNPTMMFAIKHLIISVCVDHGKLVCKHYEIAEADEKELYEHARRTVNSLQSAVQSSYEIVMKEEKSDARNEGKGT